MLITSVQAAKKTVTLDVVQFFGGAAATKAAAEDGGDVSNDYWLRNANPKLRTLPVTPAAKITVNALAWQETGSATEDVTKTLAQLGGYPGLGDSLFTVTVTRGSISSIAQVYLP